MINANHIIILVGVCGTGKSALGQKVAQKLEVPFFDADKLVTFKDVSLENWLTAIESLIVSQSSQKGCVISCSILKKEQRKRLTANIKHELDWVFMNDTYENVVQRIEKMRLLNGLFHRSNRTSRLLKAQNEH